MYKFEIQVCKVSACLRTAYQLYQKQCKNFRSIVVQWGSENLTRQIYKWQKFVWLPNGFNFKSHKKLFPKWHPKCPKTSEFCSGIQVPYKYLIEKVPNGVQKFYTYPLTPSVLEELLFFTQNLRVLSLQTRGGVNFIQKKLSKFDG